MAKRVTADGFEAEVLKSDALVLVDFYSESCVSCKRLSPLLSQIEKEYSQRLKVFKVNVNFDAELSEKYKIQAAPTVIFFKGGTETERLRGAVQEAQLRRAIENLI